MGVNLTNISLHAQARTSEARPVTPAAIKSGMIIVVVCFCVQCRQLQRVRVVPRMPDLTDFGSVSKH